MPCPEFRKFESYGVFTPFVSPRPNATVSRVHQFMKTNAYAVQSAATPLAPFSLQRRDPGERDVQIEILYCGVCHSDVHTARNEWQGTTYRVCPAMRSEEHTSELQSLRHLVC